MLVNFCLLKHFTISILLLFVCQSLLSQSDKKTNFAVEVGGQLSNSGIATVLNFNMNYSSHGIYLGPMLSISDSYFPKSNVTGFNTGYRFSILESGKLSSLIGIHYSLLSYRLDYKSKSDHIQEIYLIQSFKYKLGNHFSIRNDIGIGQYSEFIYFENEGERQSFRDFGSFIRLSCVYDF